MIDENLTCAIPPRQFFRIEKFKKLVLITEILGLLTESWNMPDLCKFLWLFLSGIVCLPVFAQITEKSETFQFTGSPEYRSIPMGGYLDAKNTYSHGYGRNRVQGFQPMMTVSICNRGSTTVNAPRLIFNQTGCWYDNNSLVNEIFRNTETDKEQLLALLAFFIRNRIHYESPAYGCLISNPLKLLGMYGYLTCGSASTVITSMAELVGWESRQWSLRTESGLRHHIPEVRINDRFVIIDMDAEVFYLDYDNETLLGRDDIVTDKYLIRRTDHYGKIRFPGIETSLLYNSDNEMVTVPSCLDHRLDYNLRMGEAFIFDWTERSQIAHKFGTPPLPVPFFIANSRFEYQPPVAQSSLSCVFDMYRNIKKQFDSNKEMFLCADQSGTAWFQIEFDSPFIFLDSEVSIDYFRRSAQNSFWIEFSPDNITWWPAWAAADTGRVTEQISLNPFIDRPEPNRRYKFFLRFKMWAQKRVEDLRIYDLTFKSFVQTTTRFMPSLKLGENEIKYTDTNHDRNVEVTVRWQESLENRPPTSDFNTVFPEDGATVDGCKFIFRWEPAEDPDGDEITDYEFMLSDRQDMRFPLSPTFSLYTNVQDSDLNSFEIPVPGFLNHDNTYYWHVRAKDEHGAWSEWSDTWSFKPNTVMIPLNVRVIGSGQEQWLFWEPNPDGLPPEKYMIYGSSASNGFAPDTASLLGQTCDTQFSVETDSVSFFRVAGVSSSGAPGGPSPIAIRVNDVDKFHAHPAAFSLSQNFPNPFNESTTIIFSVPHTCHVVLKVYNTTGRLVSILWDRETTFGLHTTRWDGRDQTGKPVSSGVYLYHMQTESFSRSRSFLLLK